MLDSEPAVLRLLGRNPFVDGAARPIAVRISVSEFGVGEVGGSWWVERPGVSQWQCVADVRSDARSRDRSPSPHKPN